MTNEMVAACVTCRQVLGRVPTDGEPGDMFARHYNKYHVDGLPMAA